MNQKKRDIAKEILEGIRAIKAGHGRSFHKAEESADVAAVRQNLDVSQSTFAALLGVSVRTLQEWEQHRREPSGPAKKLIEIAKSHPEILLEELNSRRAA